MDTHCDTSAKTPSTASAFGSQEFPKDFLRPYGAPVDADDIEDSVIANRLKSNNCEWLQRPGIAASELAETLLRCKDVTAESEKLNAKDLMFLMEQRIEQLSRIIAPFRDDPSTAAQREGMSKEQVAARLTLLKTAMDPLNDDGLMIDFLASYMRVGNAMFSMAIQIKVAYWILSNPQQAASLASPAPYLRKFADSPSLQTYAAAMYANIQQEARAKTYGLSIAQTNLMRHIRKLEPWLTVPSVGIFLQERKYDDNCGISDDEGRPNKANIIDAISRAEF